MEKFRVRFEAEEVREFFESASDRVYRSLQKTFSRIAKDLVEYVRNNKLQGQVLEYHSGSLSASVSGRRVTLNSGEVYAVVSVGGDKAPYAEVQEEGGSFFVPSHLSASRLGNTYSVSAHIATFQPTHFMRTSLEENVARFEELVQEALSADLQ